MSVKLPAPGTPIGSLDRLSLTVFTEIARRRATTFLWSLQNPTRFAQALLVGYTETEHRAGVYILLHVAGEVPFKDWRRLQTLTPSRDPDLPSLVGELEDFAVAWRRRALAAARNVEDPGMRSRALLWLAEDVVRPSRVWRARLIVDMVESIGEVPSLAAAWEELSRLGFADELADFHSRMASVRRHILSAPVGANEVSDIHVHRESYGHALARWVDARRAEHIGRPALVRDQLGLGDEIPPAAPQVRVGMLSSFGSTARA